MKFVSTSMLQLRSRRIILQKVQIQSKCKFKCHIHQAFASTTASASTSVWKRGSIKNIGNSNKGEVVFAAQCFEKREIVHADNAVGGADIVGAVGDGTSISTFGKLSPANKSACISTITNTQTHAVNSKGSSSSPSESLTFAAAASSLAWFVYSFYKYWQWQHYKHHKYHMKEEEHLFSDTASGYGYGYEFLPLTANEKQSHEHVRPPPRPPRQFGSRIPYSLLNNNTIYKSRSISSSQRRSFGTTNGKNGNDTDNEMNNIPLKGKQNRSECAICKKYSQGPCGELFIRWLDCIDNNDKNDNDNDESPCDQFIPPLDECLKANSDYYDNINMYDDDDDDNNNDGADNATPGDMKNKWSDFIHELEQQRGSGKDKESEETNINITYRSFPTDKCPEMQIRLDQHIGIATFHPRITPEQQQQLKSEPEHKSGQLTLMLGFIKDQNGNILAAASADELFYNYSSNGGDDGDNNDENETCVIRFHTVPGETKDVIACGLYSSEEHPDELFIYRKVERLPI